MSPSFVTWEIAVTRLSAHWVVLGINWGIQSPWHDVHHKERCKLWAPGRTASSGLLWGSVSSLKISAVTERHSPAACGVLVPLKDLHSDEAGSLVTCQKRVSEPLGAGVSWVLGIKCKSPGLHSKLLYPLSHLAGPGFLCQEYPHTYIIDFRIIKAQLTLYHMTQSISF